MRQPKYLRNQDDDLLVHIHRLTKIVESYEILVEFMLSKDMSKVYSRTLTDSEVVEAVDACQGNKAKASRLLGVSTQFIHNRYNRMKNRSEANE